jgi:serine O-acetyltransferase
VEPAMTDVSHQIKDLHEERDSAEGEVLRWNLDALVSALRFSREVSHNIRPKGTLSQAPSRETLSRILEDLSAALFPTHYSQSELGRENIDYFVGDTLNRALVSLVEQVRRSLLFSGDVRGQTAVSSDASAIVRDFAAELPSIRGALVGDLRAAYSGDPAATNLYEILLSYPGMAAIIYHRLANSLYGRGAPLIARLISRIAHSKTGIDIHPGAKIGSDFFIDHGTGVVIGETTIIGARVRVYQAVTLGARSFPADDSGALIKGAARHPIIEDDVVIYAGATILGRVTIGRGSTIGGNVWLTHSVPPNSQVSQAEIRNSESVERRADTLVQPLHIVKSENGRL